MKGSTLKLNERKSNSKLIFDSVSTFLYFFKSILWTQIKTIHNSSIVARTIHVDLKVILGVYSNQKCGQLKINDVK